MAVAFIGIVMVQLENNHLYAQDISFTNLPILELDYRVDPYIKVAGQLQDMGQKAAIQQLFRLATYATNDALLSGDNEERVAILCRMLFVPRPPLLNLERPAFLGGPGFIAEDDMPEPTSYKNWPNEPIEIVDGIPFAVVYGHNYEGVKDPCSAKAYVEYCASFGSWNSVHYVLKSDVEKQQAAKKLFASPKWKRPLNFCWEKDYLLRQIQ